MRTNLRRARWRHSPPDADDTDLDAQSLPRCAWTAAGAECFSICNCTGRCKQERAIQDGEAFDRLLPSQRVARLTSACGQLRRRAAHLRPLVLPVERWPCAPSPWAGTSR